MTDLETMKALLEKTGMSVTVSLWPYTEWNDTPDGYLSSTDPDIEVELGDIDISFDFDKKDHSIKSLYISDNRTPRGY